MARALLEARQPVRAVVRNPEKAKAWAEAGCEIAVADMADRAALTRAFTNVDAVFVLPPPNFDPEPGFPEAREEAGILASALAQAKPRKVVCVSTIGAQATRENLLSQRTILERLFGELPMPVTFLRPGWFLENLAWDVASARDAGVIHSFLQPLDKRFPMVATEDIGRLAADLARESWTGKRVVELAGPRRISMSEIAAIFAETLRRPVCVEVVARETWEPMFRTQGMKNPLPRIQMLDGFNEGWIDFEDSKNVRLGTVDARTVVEQLVANASKA
jgi:uncharacterized protein YbjT (DUF2867 family)